MAKGFDALEKKLKRLEKNADELNGTNEVSFEVLFNSKFLSKYTSFSSYDEFTEALPAKTKEEFEALPEEDADEFAKKFTRFETWRELLQKAANEYALKELFKGIN